MMNNTQKAKSQKDLEKFLQILGHEIGPVRINKKGGIVILDKKTKKEFSVGKLK